VAVECVAADVLKSLIRTVKTEPRPRRVHVPTVFYVAPPAHYPVVVGRVLTAPYTSHGRYRPFDGRVAWQSVATY